MEIFREYDRSSISGLFGVEFNPGSWNSGVVRVGDDLVLLVTMTDKPLSHGKNYDDGFEDSLTLVWQSQTSTAVDSMRGKMLVSGGSRVFLFVRESKLRNGKACPFTCFGAVELNNHWGERPINCRWNLPVRMPVAVQEKFGVYDLQFQGSDFCLSPDDMPEGMEEDLRDCCPAGEDASEAVQGFMKRWRVGGNVSDCAEYLRGYGAWEDDELSDHETNLERLVWLAAGDLNEQGEIHFAAY